MVPPFLAYLNGGNLHREVIEFRVKGFKRKLLSFYNLVDPVRIIQCNQ